MNQSERYCIATQAGPDGFATLVYDHERGNEIVSIFARRSEAQAEADRLNAAAAVGVVGGGE